MAYQRPQARPVVPPYPAEVGVGRPPTPLCPRDRRVAVPSRQIVDFLGSRYAGWVEELPLDSLSYLCKEAIKFDRRDVLEFLLDTHGPLTDAYLVFLSSCLPHTAAEQNPSISFWALSSLHSRGIQNFEAIWTIAARKGDERLLNWIDSRDYVDWQTRSIWYGVSRNTNVNATGPHDPLSREQVTSWVLARHDSEGDYDAEDEWFVGCENGIKRLLDWLASREEISWDVSGWYGTSRNTNVDATGPHDPLSREQVTSWILAHHATHDYDSVEEWFAATRVGCERLLLFLIQQDDVPWHSSIWQGLEQNAYPARGPRGWFLSKAEVEKYLTAADCPEESEFVASYSSEED